MLGNFRITDIRPKVLPQQIVFAWEMDDRLLSEFGAAEGNWAISDYTDTSVTVRCGDSRELVELTVDEQSHRLNAVKKELVQS